MKKWSTRKLVSADAESMPPPGNGLFMVTTQRGLETVDGKVGEGLLVGTPKYGFQIIRVLFSGMFRNTFIKLNKLLVSYFLQRSKFIT